MPNFMWHFYINHFAVASGEIWGKKVRDDVIWNWSCFLKSPFEDILFP